jgi:DNA topoisomerase-1
MKLVIVESPTKAKTISKFLGQEYKVESSYGHIRDLPKSKLGIDVENNFTPEYIVPIKNRPTLKNLKEAVKKSDEVILATDEDREGEAIAWHLFNALDLQKAKKGAYRIVFHEITQGAILNALEHPRGIDKHLVDAQQARRILDRLVGYKLSPFLWKKVAKGLSAGRVQSVAVRLIVEREEEIRKFKAEEYWTIEAKLKAQNGSLDALVVSKNGEALDKFAVKNSSDAATIAEDLKKSEFEIASIERKTVKKNPPPPFITSTLQQEAAKRLGYSSKKTMFIAQQLYENGLITYMRTDSVNLSADSLAAAKTYLSKNFGADYAAEAPRVWKTQSKSAQEAHEAIRPTNVNVSPDEASLTAVAEKKLYKLIWQRFLASQMPQAVLDTTSISINAHPTDESKKYGLKTTGTILRFDGYLKVWPQKFEAKELPEISEKEKLALEEVIPLQHFTEPPARYSEASLIKALEGYGIGRPSTYAPTISVIQIRNYVKKEGGRFFPTEIGEMVNKVLTENFNEVVDIPFTAEMEKTLDEIAEGREKWQDVISGFYGPFAKKLAEKYEEVKKTVVAEKTDQICEKCGKHIVIKFGRFGKFLACEGFPECKNTKKLEKEAPKSTGLKCPECGLGEIVERRVSRGRARGKIFWGCSKYPACKYASWEDPTNSSTKPEKKAAIVEIDEAMEKE